jgi:DNA-binding LacI/PurR family transcriptional regulator
LLSVFVETVAARTEDKGVLSMAHDLRRRYSGAAAMSALHPFDRDLASMTAVLVPIVNNQEFTAILAPNDRLARRMFRWFRSVDIDIPKRFSILSFDDRFENQYPFPISSINFGFERLGRVTVSILRGEYGGSKKPRRGISVPCFLNHRASIAQREG